MMIIGSRKSYTQRLLLLFAAMLVIAAGLTLRRYGYALGLSFAVVKYGGSVLWGSMVYLLVATAFPSATRHRLAIGIACGIAIAVEFVRLIHFPALDAFRATSFGTLLLGRVFSLWNIACYLGGIGMVVLIRRRFEKRQSLSAPFSAPSSLAE
ncbi:DUF2809 domain-containing protein [Agrobacterium larrymoorei]|uniref:DUF2809 domain-containing protein n=1 Tax=Agrobacterium larrymoorei TaxID=160699 RepID=A0AAF0KJE1_9HYPH|nr:DUF2809 domain-containing protein [Agrobacterium larrymoorei]WHA42299.1 DUF2809 domain-containing protein [Agrobacterium larrymoorei]